MIKVAVFALLIVLVSAGLDVSSLGVPADTHQTSFGGAIPLSSGLADEGQQTLQVVNVSPEEESKQSVSNVKQMFANAFNSIQAQRAELLAESSTASP